MCRFVLEAKGNGCVSCWIVILAQTVKWVLPSESLFVSWCLGLWCSVTVESVDYCPLEACTGHSAAAVTTTIVSFVLWLDAHETFCSTSLCVHLPLRHPPPSQRQDLRTPFGLKQESLASLGGEILSGDRYGLTQHLWWLKSLPVFPQGVMGLMHKAAKQEHDCLYVFFVYQTTTLRFTLLF